MGSFTTKCETYAGTIFNFKIVFVGTGRGLFLQSARKPKYYFKLNTLLNRPQPVSTKYHAVKTPYRLTGKYKKRQSKIPFIVNFTALSACSLPSPSNVNKP